MMIDHARYSALEIVGEGSQGRVVRVVDRERPRLPLVAKLIAHPKDESGAEAQLAGEFALLSRLLVPGLVRAHDFARDRRGVLFLVEDFVDGVDPITFVKEDAARFVRLAADLAETLAALHDAGFVHADVKPGNVRVPSASVGGRAMLLDLGAALSNARELGEARILTPAYAAPEVKAGARSSPASDLYSLGATLWACATNAPPPASRTGLRDHASWVPPRIADVVEALLHEHPSDRPRTARDALAALGRVATTLSFESGSRGPHVHEDEAKQLLATQGVTYLVGASGSGKSHLAREVVTRTLVNGRSARLIRFPEADAELTTRLVAFLRGSGELPFTSDEQPADEPSTSLLLVLDDLHAAPLEVADALEAYRCRMHAGARKAEGRLSIIATARAAPEGASRIVLEPLASAQLDRLAAALGIEERARAALVREAGGLPGWLVAALGRVPLTKEAVLARVGTLSKPAQELLAAVATMGGVVPARLVSKGTEESPLLTQNGEAAECFAAGLLERERDFVRLASPNLAGDLAGALGGFAISDRAAAIALRDELSAACLFAIASAPSPPEARTKILERAAARARHEESRAIEIDALLALVADPKERSADRLARLERLTRDAGTARSHPQVLAWLEEAAKEDPSLTPLALRRRAEERARAGDFATAEEIAARAIEAARDVRAEEAYALATKGAVALWSAKWSEASDAFRAARSALEEIGLGAPAPAVDSEEVARLEHNLGVVALYRGEHAEAATAFERSVVIKRALGDRAGVRACLLNLGLALTQDKRRWSDAHAALVEAIALAEALGQHAGRGWCLAASAQLEVHRGDARAAERFVAEAEAIGDVVPKTVRADLKLLRAQIALLEGNGRAATSAIRDIDPELRAADALIDARALVLGAKAKLATLPVDRRQVARDAIAAIRRARAGGLPDPAKEAEEVLREARGASTKRRPEAPAVEEAMNDGTMQEADPIWSLLGALASAPVDEGAVKLTTLIVGQARAERAILAALDEAGNVFRGWGSDLDGLAISDPEKRVDGELVRRARPARLIYEPAVPNASGTGSRLAIASARAIVIVEHRFKPAAFDRITEVEASRWLTLAELVLRIANGPTTIDAATAMSLSLSLNASRALSPALAPSTAVPRREPLREFPEIIGRSPALRRALAQLDAAVDTELPVLVEGETGTGKELFARALHDHGARRSGPFVAVNCAAIADALFEAELFGHARGAFTGADRARGGLLARAEGGTLFLDEIGELPLARQATLLRVLESRRYRPVGSDDERSFDVRIVAATNRDLDAAVAAGAFRKDLLFRLRVLDIVVPPLRERKGDIEVLLRQFLARAGARAVVTPAALDILESYAFPGNVRELLHHAQRLAAARLDRIDVANLPRSIRAGASDAPDPKEREVKEVESALARTGGNISRAAALLGLTRHGLKKRMLRLGLRAKETAG